MTGPAKVTRRKEYEFMRRLFPQRLRIDASNSSIKHYWFPFSQRGPQSHHPCKRDEKGRRLIKIGAMVGLTLPGSDVVLAALTQLFTTQVGSRSEE